MSVTTSPRQRREPPTDRPSSRTQGARGSGPDHGPGVRTGRARLRVGTEGVGWMALAILARLPLVARIEGIHDHDQAVVGLMAMDIAAGARWPIFFDGQRYMGAVEAYTAALFGVILGHRPSAVALAPTLFFGLFVMGQFALWSRWGDRSTGRLAATLSLLGAPLATLWSFVPRGGYIEVMAWALPVLGLYRHRTRPDAPPIRPAVQVFWGWLLALGYFLNPLSAILYAALLVDWTFGRHGAEIRQRHRLDGGWVDRPWAVLIWLGAGLLGLLVLTAACHARIPASGAGADAVFVFALGRVPPPWGVGLGVATTLALIVAAAWWTGAGSRLLTTLASHVPFTMGVLLAMVPHLIYHARVALGWAAPDPSLPMWLRAPWMIGPNLQSGLRGLGPLIGTDPQAPAYLLHGQGVAPPEPSWPVMTQILHAISPGIVALVVGLLVMGVWTDRHAWRTVFALKGRAPSPPSILAQIVLAVAVALFLLQATSPNASSIRYLVAAWIVLPGLLAVAIRRLPHVVLRVGVTGMLMAAWGLAQGNLWADLDRPAPHRALAETLERRGVSGIVATTPVALLVSELSQGRVGAVEFRSEWPRLRDRFADRLATDGPVVCVVDRDFPWDGLDGLAKSSRLSLGAHLAELDRRHPGRVQFVERVGSFEIWRVDRPLAEVLGRTKRECPGDGTRFVVAGNPGMTTIFRQMDSFLVKERSIIYLHEHAATPGTTAWTKEFLRKPEVRP